MPLFLHPLAPTSRNRFYMGASSQPEERLIKHNHQHKEFTAGATDWKIVHAEEFEHKTLAPAREKEINFWKSAHCVRQLNDSHCQDQRDLVGSLFYATKQKTTVFVKKFCTFLFL